MFEVFLLIIMSLIIIQISEHIPILTQIKIYQKNYHRAKSKFKWQITPTYFMPNSTYIKLSNLIFFLTWLLYFCCEISEEFEISKCGRLRKLFANQL